MLGPGCRPGLVSIASSAFDLVGDKEASGALRSEVQNRKSKSIEVQWIIFNPEAVKLGVAKT